MDDPPLSPPFSFRSFRAAERATCPPSWCGNDHSAACWPPRTWRGASRWVFEKKILDGNDRFSGGKWWKIFGWWCNVPILKNDGVRQWDNIIPYMKWKLKHVWSHQPVLVDVLYLMFTGGDLTAEELGLKHEINDDSHRSWKYVIVVIIIIIMMINICIISSVVSINMH